jgi:hypothetical protein
MAKMLRDKKRFGRCKVQGHGQHYFCEVCQEIQSDPYTRHRDKVEAKKEINQQIDELRN